MNSMLDADFSWTKFYREFSNKLIEYKDDRALLIDKIVSVFQNINMKLPTLESGGLPTDIDPFTVFGLFNKSMTDINRARIAEGLALEFDIKANPPKTFEGIPLLNPLCATFYGFRGDRIDGDIDNLWSLYVAAIAYEESPTETNRNAFVSAYDVVHEMYLIKWNITMALFWIRPCFYINLDSRNRWYMCDTDVFSADLTGVLKEKFKSTPWGDEYLQINKLIMKEIDSDVSQFKNFLDLSFEAWRYSEEVNRQKKLAGALSDGDVRKTHYWIYAPGPSASQWDECHEKGIMLLGWGEAGDLSHFESRDDMKHKMQEVHMSDASFKNSTLAMWQFLHDVQPGDIVFAKRGNSTIIGRGIVQEGYTYDESRSGTYKNVKYVNWTHNGSWIAPTKMAGKTLTDVTAYSNFVQEINSLILVDDPDIDDESNDDYPLYSQQNFFDDVYMEEKRYKDIVTTLRLKKNIILQGAPGVGKTFAAKRLAYSIMGKKDISRVMMIQFHQSYSYEDFIMGYRPTATGFELHTGAFYDFCKLAETDKDNDYFFIIDEINRGNLSRIFGELFMLIESDKRGIDMRLLYSDETFSVPENVYIIGLMNTADRSLAMLDFALRRRFAFITLKPGFDTNGFQSYKSDIDDDRFNRLIECVKSLNEDISSDDTLGEGFCIGHSYFCGLPKSTDDEVVEPGDSSALNAIVEYELIPLLGEYWFDEPSKVNKWSSSLRNAIK